MLVPSLVSVTRLGRCCRLDVGLRVVGLLSARKALVGICAPLRTSGISWRHIYGVFLIIDPLDLG